MESLHQAGIPLFRVVFVAYFSYFIMMAIKHPKNERSILKIDWERSKTHAELDVATTIKLLAPIIADPIEQLILLSNGCANTHYKVTFKNSRPPVVIRIYLRDQSAARREMAIQKLVADKIPVPQIYYTDDECVIYPLSYAITEWVNGVLMRGLILEKDETAIRESVYAAGVYLNELRQIKFAQAGFFTEDLCIRPFAPEEAYLPYTLNLLQDTTVQQTLGAALKASVTNLITTQANILTEENEANLTHCDYDPANILINLEKGQWKIAAILDWEFASAATYLLDIGQMLRYAHRLPIYYENSFIAGIVEHGTPLPANWKKQAKLMDLLCLLQLLQANPSSVRPKACRDVISLIADTVKNWNSS